MTAAAAPLRRHTDAPGLRVKKQLLPLPSSSEPRGLAGSSPSASAGVLQSSSATLRTRDESGSACSDTGQAEPDLDRVTAAEEQAEVLRWENGLLRKRLERMVAYIELLRRDLDEARRQRPSQVRSSEVRRSHAVSHRKLRTGAIFSFLSEVVCRR